MTEKKAIGVKKTKKNKKTQKKRDKATRKIKKKNVRGKKSAGPKRSHKKLKEGCQKKKPRGIMPLVGHEGVGDGDLTAFNLSKLGPSEINWVTAPDRSLRKKLLQEKHASRGKTNKRLPNLRRGTTKGGLHRYSRGHSPIGPGNAEKKTPKATKKPKMGLIRTTSSGGSSEMCFLGGAGNGLSCRWTQKPYCGTKASIA